MLLGQLVIDGRGYAAKLGEESLKLVQRAREVAARLEQDHALLRGGKLRCWKLGRAKELGHAIDGDIETRWDTRKPQSPDMWLQIELPAETDISGLTLDTGKSRGDWPRAYTIEFSKNGTEWEKPALQGKGDVSVIDYLLPKPARTKFSRISQLGSTPGTYWSIHELDVLGVVAK